MKALGNILTAFLLSLIIVFLSAGATVEHCLHRGEIKIATVHERPCCSHGTHDGFNTFCMEYMQVKLAPTTVTDAVHLDPPLLFSVPVLVGWTRTFCQGYLHRRLTGRQASIPHAPPRAMLAHLCTFLL